MGEGCGGQAGQLERPQGSSGDQREAASPSWRHTQLKLLIDWLKVWKKNSTGEEVTIARTRMELALSEQGRRGIRSEWWAGLARSERLAHTHMSEWSQKGSTVYGASTNGRHGTVNPFCWK
jgi:hypothetical protein